MINKKKISIKCLVCSFVLATTIMFGGIFYIFRSTMQAKAYTISSWNLVDSGKHLDWDGSTKYMDLWYDGVRTWNAHKPGVIRVDTWKTIEDVKISDYSEDSNTRACTYSSGKIKFNTFLMDKDKDSNKTLKTIIHELGHALGLDHNDDTTSVLYPYSSSITALSDDDKAGYNYLYEYIYK